MGGSVSQQGPREPRRRARGARGRPGKRRDGMGEDSVSSAGRVCGRGGGDPDPGSVGVAAGAARTFPRVEGVTEKHPGRGAADARSDHSEAEAPAPRPGLASRSPSTRRTRSLRQHLPGAHCAPACQDLGAQPRRRDTRPHGKRSHSARLPVQALLTGARRAPTSWLQGAGPTPPVCFSARPPPLVKFRALQWGVPSSQQETGYSLCQSSVPPQGDSRRPLEPQLCPRAAWGAGAGAVGCGGSAVHTCGVSTLFSE